MKKRPNHIYGILFGILMVLLFLPLAEEQLHLFEFKRLGGVYHKAPEPEFSLENYQTGQWQKQAEAYASENFGFRNPIIRIYNQYLYRLFHKTFNNEVYIGKDGWLYQKDGITQHFGLMGRKYHLRNEDFERNLAEETRSLVKIRAILKEYGVELMTFTLPVKSHLYPEHLRPQRYVDTAFHAETFYNEQLVEAGFPHINMDPWFLTLQEQYPFTLFYEQGSHWASGAVLATDSLLRYMETLKGDRLARIGIGEPYEVPERNISPQDRDLAELLNIVWIPKQRLPLYEFPVTIEADSNTVYPSVLFVGTSYFWYITPRVPLEKVFSRRNLIFYNASYYTNEEKTILDLNDIDYLREVLNHDYVVYFENVPQLYSDGFQFFGKTLIGLCISEERFNEKAAEVADSLAQYQPQEGWTRGNYLYLAKTKLYRNPELFEELRGTEVPAIRNPRVEKLLVEREIRNDRDWAFLLQCKAKYDSIGVDRVFEMEASNLIHHQRLLRDNVFFTPYDYFNLLVEEHIDALRRRPESTGSRLELRPLALAQIDSLINCNGFENDSLMRMACALGAIQQNLENSRSLEVIRQKAADWNVSVDKMFRNDVLWIYRNIDAQQYFTTERIRTLFDNYPIEHGLWTSSNSREAILTKARNNNNPFVVALDNDVVWLRNNRANP